MCHFHVFRERGEMAILRKKWDGRHAVLIYRQCALETNWT